MISSSSIVTVYSGISKSTSSSSTSLTSSALVANSTAYFPLIFIPKILWCTTLTSFSGGYFNFFFHNHLLWGWLCIDSWLSLFLSSLHSQYLLVRLSCYKDGLCVPWKICISRFTELVRTIPNSRFSVNDLLKSVLLIVLRLRFREVFVIDSLNTIRSAWSKYSYCWLVELGSTIL